MIDRETYELERAIVDKAEAVCRRLAPLVYSRGGALPLKVAEHPDYRACTNGMRGRVAQYEILTNPPERFVAYIGAVNDHPARTNPARLVTTWTGDPLGRCTLGSGWRVNSFIGSRMYQAHARVAGREYTGRTFGEGMSIVLRETAASKRKRLSGLKGYNK